MMCKTILLLTALWVLSTDAASQNQETHLANLRQLTFGGENAEAYFSSDGKDLIFQSTHDPYPCDQIFSMGLDGTPAKLLSTGKGRTTCGYFYPDKKQILYSSTHEKAETCPPPPDRSKGYVWGLYSYDIYRAAADGTNPQLLTSSPGYDAEATISPDGKQIVFTSDRDGDLELYLMDLNGKNVRRITHFPGYDGGAFFSPDSRKLVFRGRHITDEKELTEYRALLQNGLVKPSQLEIFIIDTDGKNLVQVTNNGAANFCPYFHPDGKRIIFASNMHDPAKRDFELYMIGVDGKGLERITFNPTFDGFPMFNSDGTKLVFASNRNAAKPGETNIFLADWMENSPDINEANIRKDVAFFASDHLKGRLTGTPEAKEAANYIASEFRKAGLLSAPGMEDYFQKFEFTSGVKIGTENSLALRAGENKTDYRLNEDFIPTGFASDEKLDDVPLIFAGYGIRAPNLSYDDYKGIDVKDKVVVTYRFGPEGDDPKSGFAEYYPLRYKAMTARDQGAAALLVVADDPKEDELLALRKDASFGTSGIPVLSIKRKVLVSWLEAAKLNFPEARNPHGKNSFDVPGVLVSLQCRLIREKSQSDNVIGWLPAPGEVNETIVIGAHYDHLGLGVEGSLAEKWGEVHNGADDNASGTAGVLELARFFSRQRPQLRKNILFVAFGGEELGVLGSSFFVKNPIVPLKNIVAMLNMDMIGRLRENKLAVGGTGTSTAWKNILTSANQQDLKLSMTEDGYGPSDHSMFYSKDIPVLFFFTGAHSDYHKPGDDAERIEYVGMVKILNYVRAITEETMKLQHAPDFVRVKSSSQEIASRGFRVFLGTIPDYTEEVQGVKLSGVREDSPAEKAGLKAGDIIIEFAGKQIHNVYDYTYALQEHKPGDVVSVIVQRDGASVKVEVTLEKRASAQ